MPYRALRWQRGLWGSPLSHRDGVRGCGREYCYLVWEIRVDAQIGLETNVERIKFVEAARVLAAKLVRSSNRVESRIQQGYLTILSREPSALELKMLSELYKAELSAFQANDKEAEKLLAVGEAPLENELNQAEAAAMTMVVRTIMNLSETITKH